EMFWLYFPDLRNVMVNYYTYNDRSDAQWMSFDDLFWKRKFNAQIYRTSDKFDREIEDYRFGVDALYEAEKIKGEIRKWEHDVWNY
ncbi:MAG: gliding motility protein GldN, partial [Crocinitomicaceae bacterium]|nr:gliding motility protein GldN [Crocinitomicaceae bacterium]